MSAAQRRVAHARLVSQSLAKPRFRSPADVVSHLGAVQSQEYAVAKWSLGQRSSGVREHDVDAALRDGRILRTHVLRPTWHFLAREDARWILGLSGPRVHAQNASRYRQLELDDALLRQARRILERTLSDGVHRTRRELATVFADAGIAEATGPRLAHMMMHAELDAVVTSGAPAGRQTTYALFDERVPPAAAMPRDEALARLVMRYFDGHGPATVRDCAWWSGLTIRDVRRGVAALGGRLEGATVDRLELLFTGELPKRTPRGPSVHLLQGYDEYHVAFTESRRLLDIDGVTAGMTGRDAFMHPLVLDTQVVGLWRPGSGAEAVELRPLRPLPEGARAAVGRAVKRYERFRGRAGPAPAP